MMVLVECAKSAAYYAACVAQESLFDGEVDGEVGGELPEASSLAKAYCSDAFFQCAAESIQMHGGVGITWEYDPHLYFKRAKSTETFLGAAAYHREKIAQVVPGGDCLMKISFSPEDEQFRQEVANWLKENLTGEYEKIRFRGGPGDEHMYHEERQR